MPSMLGRLCFGCCHPSFDCGTDIQPDPDAPEDYNYNVTLAGIAGTTVCNGTITYQCSLLNNTINLTFVSEVSGTFTYAGTASVAGGTLTFTLQLSPPSGVGFSAKFEISPCDFFPIPGNVVDATFTCIGDVATFDECALVSTLCALCICNCNVSAATINITRVGP
jgi:hypothetical protein